MRSDCTGVFVRISAPFAVAVSSSVRISRGASSHASAVGAQLDRILEIADPEAGGGFSARSASFASAESEDSAAFDLHPRQQTVHAEVRLRVSITEPTVLRG